MPDHRSPNGGITRRNFIGGSDARILMGNDEAALIRLWREKRGEAEPEDLSGQPRGAARVGDRGPQPLLVRAQQPAGGCATCSAMSGMG